MLLAKIPLGIEEVDQLSTQMDFFICNGTGIEKGEAHKGISGN